MQLHERRYRALHRSHQRPSRVAELHEHRAFSLGLVAHQSRNRRQHRYHHLGPGHSRCVQRVGLRRHDSGCTDRPSDDSLRLCRYGQGRTRPIQVRSKPPRLPAPTSPYHSDAGVGSTCQASSPTRGTRRPCGPAASAGRALRSCLPSVCQLPVTSRDLTVRRGASADSGSRFEHRRRAYSTEFFCHVIHAFLIIWKALRLRTGVPRKTKASVVGGGPFARGCHLDQLCQSCPAKPSHPVMLHRKRRGEPPDDKGGLSFGRRCFPYRAYTASRARSPPVRAKSSRAQAPLPPFE
jgi:hypothetical protein